MAKRKRLTPANPDFLSTAPDAAEAPARGTLLGPARPPIAQVAGDTSAAAALSELSQAMDRAQAEGRLVLSLKLAQVDLGHLVRDRIATGDEELQALIESLRARGQQTPIEVVDRGVDAAPRYGLVSGWRRMAALQRLAEEGQGSGTVLALVRVPSSASDAYVAMVEENEIRVGLSYYERARIVVKSVEQGVYPDLTAGLQTLFANVSRAKRSKIKSFTRIVEALDGVLAFPAAIGERLGLDLARRLSDVPKFDSALRDRLRQDPPATAEEEQQILAEFDPHERIAAKAGIRRKAAPGPAPKISVARIDLDWDGEGALRLSGPGVDERLRGDLETWLVARSRAQSNGF